MMCPLALRCVVCSAVYQCEDCLDWERLLRESRERGWDVDEEAEMAFCPQCQEKQVQERP